MYSTYKMPEMDLWSNSAWATERKIQREKGPLKSTAELGYIDQSRIYDDHRYSELSSELLCCICQNILWKPVACATCENAFCAGCIQTWTNTKSRYKRMTCPFNCNFQEKRAPPILNNLLSKLRISCAYSSNGCDEVLSYDTLEKHENQCEFEKIPCQICQTPVSNRDRNNNHDLKQCFQQMYDRNGDQVQAQFLKLLDVVEASQQRIQVLENLLGIQSSKKQ